MAIVNSLTEQARSLLQDNGSVLRITDADMIGWYNEAMLRVSEINPFAIIESVVHVCDTMAEQTAASGLRFLGVNYQVGGNALYRVTTSILDREEPNWRSSAASPNPFHWAFHSERNKFWIYPVPDASVVIDCTIQKKPTEITRLSEGVEITPELAPALTDYLAYRGFLADAENTDNQTLANEYLAKFETTLTRHFQREAQRIGIL